MAGRKGGRCLAAVLLLLLTLVASCVPPQGIDRTVAPYTQDTIKMHLEALAERIQQRLQNPNPEQLSGAEEVALVQEYFSLASEARWVQASLLSAAIQMPDLTAGLTDRLSRAHDRRSELRSLVENIIQRQVGQALAAAGLKAPVGSQDESLLLPPSEFFFLDPPYVLVNSPRDRIKIESSYLLSPRLSLAQMEEIESEAESTGFSSLVERTSGFSLFPAWVSDADSLRQTLNIVAHEWTHAYLFIFYPLGRGYFQDHQMRTINETVADMVGREVGEAVYRIFYAPAEVPVPPEVASITRARETDFATHMRRIASSVQLMLDRGQIDEAETYMESERLQLRARGFDIRRLNQAYLALHGTYADQVAFEAPIGGQLRKLRAGSATLGDFIRLIGEVSNYADLERLTPG